VLPFAVFCVAFAFAAFLPAKAEARRGGIIIIVIIIIIITGDDLMKVADIPDDHIVEVAEGMRGSTFRIHAGSRSGPATGRRSGPALPGGGTHRARRSRALVRRGLCRALAHLIDSGVPRGEAIDNLKLVVGDPDA
jgi:hypothetical protein